MGFFGTRNYLESFRQALKAMTPASVLEAVRRQVRRSSAASDFDSKAVTSDVC